MRRLRALALTAALGAAVFVTPVRAATTIIEKSLSTLPTNEQDKDRNWVLLQPNYLQTILCARCFCPNTVTSDSSAMVPVRGYTRLKLRVRVSYAPVTLCGYTTAAANADSVFAVEYGVMPRFSSTASWDSTGAMIVGEWKRATNAGDADTVGSMIDARNVSAQTTKAEPGEFVYIWSYSTGSASGLNNEPHQNYTRDIELITRDGQPMTGDYLGVRVRQMQAFNDFVGALTPFPTGKPLFWSMDLLGSR